MFRINPDKTSREAKKVPNSVRASNKTKPITISQPPVLIKKDVNSDLNGLSSTGVDNTKTRRPHPRSNTKHDRVPSASKSSQSKNKEAKVEEHHRNLLLSKNKKHMSSACKNFALDSQNVYSKVVCVMCKQCLISVNHDECLLNYVYDKNSRGKKQMANVSIKEKQKKRKPKVKKPKKVGFIERLATPKPRQFCDSDLEVAFRRNACFVRNLEGVDLLKGDRSTNLYTINLHAMASALPICLMAQASSTKSWLWHQRLSHLNFDTINDLARNDLVAGLPKFKYHKEHLFPSCEQGKSKRASHPPKLVPNSRQRLHLLHMDLRGSMRIASINGNRYVLVIVDDYSRYTWVHFLRSKDEAPVKRRNRTLVEAARTTLIFSRASLFLWAEAIATACFTQNRSIIHRRFNKTPYEFINDRKSDILFLHVFGALCYLKNDREDIGKLGAKEYFDSVGISHQASSVIPPQQNGVVKRRNQTLVEATRTMLIFSRAPLFLWAEAIAIACYTQNRSTIHRRCNKTPYELINGIKLDINFLHVFGALCYPKNNHEDIRKLGAKGAMYDDYIGGQPSTAPRTTLAAQVPQVLQTLTATITTADTAPTPSNSSS
uniref:Retrovirus-related Pol polyprotein from transposon TNT 1-94 n=1 Tax=Tanacetum cinerariifolium TaxID=118510 RepID=A0A699JPL8_TANCI|nr:retrovirus-related Pol polyprotein from transposon TNT 1-94 [Tanacetum cinerariifolium]